MASPSRHCTTTRILLLAELSLAACEPPVTPRRRRPPPTRITTDTPEPSAATEDSLVQRLCTLRAAPPEDLVLGAGRSPATVVWNGTHFGVVWTESRDGDDCVMFARVGEDGTRTASPVRVSERGYRAADPSVAWNGASWSVLYAGGINALGDLFQARVDERGIPVGRPWRMTRGERDDSAPRIVGSGPGYGLAWVSHELDGRYTLYAQGFRTWDSREVPPTRVLNTSVILSEPRLVWTGQAWGVSVLTSRREAIGVDLARMESDGRLRSSMKRVTPGAIGAMDLQGRYAVAWDGARFTFAWSEQRDGRNEVHARRADLRGDVQGDEFVLSEREGSARWPALEAIGDGAMIAGYELERDGVPRVRVRVIHSDGWRQRGHVELQGTDGRAGSASMAWTGRALGVVTTTPRGVTFHRVTVGPCP